MINSVVFDIGQVLLSFNPLKYVEKKYNDRDITSKLYKNIFKSREWSLLDRGDISFKDAVGVCCSRDCSNSKYINEIMSSWTEILAPIEENVKIAQRLKENSYKLYLLSNFQYDAFLEVERKYDFFNIFDGKIISSFVHYNKPEEEIYKLLISSYNLNPKDTLFVDDTEDNIDAAKKLGFNTIHYKQQTELLEELKLLSLL
jgi:putative hydrolase of the HAD superfamily